MGTRSRIGIYNEDGTITSIYCQYDGYVSHNGRILVNHYSDEPKIRELMALGDLSGLGEEIGEQHAWSNPFPWGTPEYKKFSRMCTAYGRDRDEDDCEARISQDAKDFENLFEEYNYVFLAGKWLVNSWNTDGKWVLVEHELAREEAEEA